MKRILTFYIMLITMVTFVACGCDSPAFTTATEATVTVVPVTASLTTEVPATASQTATAPASASPATVAPATASQTATAPATGAVNSGVGGPLKVDIFWYTFEDMYLSRVRDAMEEILIDYPNLSVTQQDCKNSQELQTKMIETAISAGSDLLIVNIVIVGADEPAQTVCDLAKEAGIPIIFFIREISDDIVKSYNKACFVGTDADEPCFVEGQAIADFLLDDDNLNRYDLNNDGLISYISIYGDHSSIESFNPVMLVIREANRLLEGKAKLIPSPAIYHGTQFEENDYGNGNDNGNANYYYYIFAPINTANLMRSVLASYSLTDGSIELIIVSSNEQALGAIEALNEEGFNTGSGAYIPLFEINAYNSMSDFAMTTAAIEAIKAGKMTGTVLRDDRAIAQCIIDLADNVFNGEDVFANTKQYNIDYIGVNKIRIPYIWLGR